MKKIAMCILALCFCAESHAFDPSDIRIHGFISQGYLKSDENNYYFANTEDGTFQFNDFGINFSAQPTDDLRLGMQLLAHDLGEIGNNEVKIDWAYADYNLYNWLSLQVGKMKQAYGLYNQSRDIDAARTSVIMPQSVYLEFIRDTQLAITGISAYGLLPAGFEYTVQFGQLYVDDEGGFARIFARILRTDLDDVHIEFGEDTVYLHLLWRTPLDGLAFGASLDPNIEYTIETSNMTIDNDQHTWVLSVEYIYNDFSFAAEYMSRDLEMTSQGRVIGDRTMEGYYGMVAYRFTDWFELGTYYSIYYSDKDDRDGDRYTEQGQPAALAWYKDFALTARFDVDESWVFKIEGHHIDSLLEVYSSDGEPSDEGFLFAAKATFSF